MEFLKRTGFPKVSKVMGSLEVQECMKVYLKTPELHSTPLCDPPSGTHEYMEFLKRTGGGGVHTHALK